MTSDDRGARARAEALFRTGEKHVVVDPAQNAEAQKIARLRALRLAREAEQAAVKPVGRTKR
jgi:hypothetical protein